MRRSAAFDFAFGRSEGLPQFGQRLAAEQRSEKQTIRLERAANLQKHAGQIVDELQCQGGHDEVDRAIAEWQRLLIGNDERLVARKDIGAYDAPY